MINYRYFDWKEEFAIQGNKLPHIEQQGVMQFVTWRLSDSLPSEAISVLRTTSPTDSSPSALRTYRTRRMQYVERVLANGYGSCILRDNRIRRLVCDTLHFNDGKLYALAAYVVMPNHIHVLFVCESDVQALSIVRSWKHYSSLQINSALKKSGSLWQSDNFDRAIRSLTHLQNTIRYIRSNPRHLPSSDYSLWVNPSLNM